MTEAGRFGVGQGGVLSTLTDARARSAHRTPAPAVVLPQFVGARSAGVDPVDVARRAGVVLDADHAPIELTREASIRLWRAAVELTDDPALALHAAEALPYGAFDVLDYIAGNEPTLGEGLRAVVRYFGTARAGMELQLQDHGDVSSLRLIRPSDAHADGQSLFRRFSTEFTFACVLLRLRRTCATNWVPRALRTSYPDPGYPDEYARIFGCPVDYDHGRDELMIEADSLKVRQPGADDRLRQVLKRAAVPLERDEQHPGTVTRKLRRALAEQLRGSGPRLDTVARRLAMSARTLHRHLCDEGTSFQAELDALRFECATDYLLDPNLSLGEIAGLLGFTEASAFSRAFRRWHTTSPGAWRREHCAL